MHYVHISLRVSGAQTQRVFDMLADFARFPEHTRVVHAVSVDEDPEGRRISSWEVDFASGVLKWRQRDVVDPHRLNISFELVDGDLSTMEGSWKVSPLIGADRVDFDTRFDLGVPGMADILEPVAAKALTDTLTAMLRGVFGSSTEITDCASGPVAGTEVSGGGR